MLVDSQCLTQGWMAACRYLAKSFTHILLWIYRLFEIGTIYRWLKCYLTKNNLISINKMTMPRKCSSLVEYLQPFMGL